ncbi:MAG: hypothetical protein M0C28_36670 [Candidatus Moduliflexus flocculans]|nr:hypothetical protein [Candidatus Moduliflexus flocculans]
MIEKAKEKVKAGNVRFEAADLTKRWALRRRRLRPSSPATSSWNTSKTCSIFSEAARTLKTGGIFLVNELHPFKQYGGTKARFERAGKTVEVEAFVHHISDFIGAASVNDLRLAAFNEFWHEE